jgi:hypothetical protein
LNEFYFILYTSLLYLLQMELSVESDIYEPAIVNGDYIDYIPPSSKFAHGLRCPCGTRRDHVFESRASFTIHAKSKTHQKWLSELNESKMNYYSENIKLQDTIANQKLIIARLQRENDENIKLIAHLTKKLEYRDNSTLINDLLSFD